MKKSSKILLAWGVVTLAMALLVLSQPGPHIATAAFVMTSIELLIGIISVYLMVVEPNAKNRFLFLNFAIFFLMGIFSLASNLISPHIAKIDQYSPFVLVQWIKGVSYFALAFAITYVVLDSLFRDLGVRLKYAATMVVVGGFFAIYFGDILANPKYSYSTADVQDFRSVDREYSILEKAKGKAPTSEDIAAQVTLPAWRENQPVGKLYPQNNILRIKEILPYLDGENYVILLYKPINLYIVKMNVVACFFIILFFGYQYKKDPPQGAYVDKIMFLLILYCSMEIFHAWSYIHAVEWEEFIQLFVIGQYVTIFILLLIAMFFALRLRFVTSVAGEFYENELVHSAQHITRWRDWLDNIVLHYFFNPKTVKGVLFSQRTKE
jgi:hypothetical protein